MFWSLVIATGLAFISTALADSGPVAADYFTSSDLGISFALNVPNDSDDLYFSIVGPGDGTWLAIGMGSDQMANSLMLIAYPTSDGQNVTVSPRLAYGHTEPSYTPDVTVHLLDGSGVTISPDGSNNNLTVNGRCSNCRSWNGGSIDVSSTKQKMIFAYGPWVGNPDSVSADLRMHFADGVFLMDMTKATGPGGPPTISDTRNQNAVEVKLDSSRDTASPVHACIMVFTFVGLLPFGVLLLRIMGWTRLHGINQIFASVLGLTGASLGIYISTRYNRGKEFNSAHQVLGLLVIGLMIIQLVLGIMHHRIYKQTQQTTKIAPVHVWLGRIVLVCGIANGFLGFPLALASHYNFALLALVLICIPPAIFLVWCCWRRKERKTRQSPTEGESPKPLGSETFGADIRMQTMDTPGSVSRPYVEPWSRV